MTPPMAWVYAWWRIGFLIPGPRSLFTLPSGTYKQDDTYRVVLSNVVVLGRVVTPSSVRFENPGGNLSPRPLSAAATPNKVVRKREREL